MTLRTHLARLTSELSSHQQLLGELRSLREKDAQTLREKSAEVERLREEVERLAGEVEVLRGVVEEGLNERRAVREASTQVEEQDVTEVPEESEELEEEGSLVPHRANRDQTIRTDRATLDSPTNPGASSTAAQGPSVSVDFTQPTSRPAAPTAAHVSRRTSRGRSKHVVDQDPLAAPFPHIRGGHLEKLFFSGPEHNTKTCTACHRRRRRPKSPCIPGRNERDMRVRVEDADEEDGKLVDGSHQQPKGKGKQREHVTFSRDPTGWRQDGERDSLPPQTVLARVLRELEDDFTHYKRLAFHRIS